MRSLKFYLLESMEPDTIDLYNKKIQWIRIGPAESKTDNDKLRDLQLKALTFYDVYDVKSSTTPIIKPDMPVLMYANFHENTPKIIKANKLTTWLNMPEETSFTGNKLKWHEVLGDKTWIPKTRSKSGIPELKLPIVAKPNNGMSGIGIEVLKTDADVKRAISDSNLECFSEFIDIDTEWRVLLYKSKPISVLQRIPRNSISTKKPGEELDFIYIEQDSTNETITSILNQLDDILFELNDYIEVDVNAIDVALTKKGKVFVIEQNSCPGLGSLSLVRFAQHILEESFGTLPAPYYDIINEVQTKYQEIIKSDYKSEFDKSIAPK